MKRMFTILMTAAVLACLLAGMTTVAFADQELDYVALYDVVLEPGQPLPATANTDSCGKVTSLSWEKWNFSTNTWEAVTGNVENGNAYRMTARITAEPGYTFAHDCQTYINGEWMNEWAQGDGSTYVDVISAIPVGLEYVHYISFASEPEVAEGGDPAAAAAALTAPTDAPYVILDAEWSEYDMVDNSIGVIHGNFEKGKAYQFEISLAPKAGYWFDRDVRIDSMNDYNRGMKTDRATAWAVTNYYLTTPIDKLDLTVTGVGEGKNIADVTLSVPAGANYSIRSWELLEDNSHVSSGTFGKHIYNLRVWFAPAAGYHLADGATTTINGEPANYTNAYGNGCLTEMHYDYRTVIDKVEITVTGVETGKAAADVKVSVPEGVNYEITNRHVVDSDYNHFEGTFGKDGYWVITFLEPKEGYCFSEDTVVTVNGKEPQHKDVGGDYCYAEQLFEFRETIDKVELTVTGMEQGKPVADVKIMLPDGAKYKVEQISIYDQNWDTATGTVDKNCYTADIYLEPLEGYYFSEDLEIVTNGKLDYKHVDNSWMNVEVDFDFTEKITRLELPAWPAIKAGDPVPAATPVDPDGKPYQYALFFLDFEEEELAEGTFANDKTYAAMYQAMADEGYSFADDLVITIGGQTYNGWVQNYGNGVITIQMYALGNTKLYSRFDVTVDRPAAGAQPGRVYVSDSAAYKLEDFEWGVADNKDGKNIDVPGEVFKVGDHVYLGLEFSVEDGLIDPNAKVYINGTEYATIGEFTEFSGRSMHTAVYLGEMKATVNPNTGDNTPVAALTLLAVASVLGMGLLVSRRKAI